MIYIIFGTSGSFTEVCATALSAALVHNRVEHDLVDASSLTELGKAAVAAQGDVIVVARKPSTDLIQHVRTMQISAVVAAPHCASMLAFWLTQSGDALEAWRGTTAEFSGLMGLAAAPRISLVRPVPFEAYSHLAAKIARTWHLDPPPYFEGANEFSSKNDLSMSYHPSQLEPLWKKIAPWNKEQILSSVLELDRGLISGLDYLSIPLNTLTQISDLQPLEGAIDVTGRARGLFCGPYVRLPIGQWVATLELATSSNLRGVPWMADVVRLKDGQVKELARSEVKTGERSSWTIDLSFSNDDPNTPLEIRLFVTKAIFDGTVSVRRLDIAREEAAKSHR
ncbi:hypothetical protein E2F50_06670 [Rhizobium deserti]|uniref:Uncharacterized protein n=1 Tax=Rhizobium deserti TaxID=2547961 RepID=A0A4R5UIF4_9HYPH|nr:hypothetical protein [Rhizobium deserti]TDK36607.1 hypothetical protein E2F50_06670 [Rhizobium deserti]